MKENKKSKVIVVEAKTPGEFQDLINQVNANHNVFATQTHVTSVKGEYSSTMYYTAVIYVRCEE